MYITDHYYALLHQCLGHMRSHLKRIQQAPVPVEHEMIPVLEQCAIHMDALCDPCPPGPLGYHAAAVLDLQDRYPIIKDHMHPQIIYLLQEIKRVDHAVCNDDED